MFGVPFVTSMVIGTFFLAQITQARYIQHDHKIRVMSQEEKLDLQPVSYTHLTLPTNREV